MRWNDAQSTLHREEQQTTTVAHASVHASVDARTGDNEFTILVTGESSESILEMATSVLSAFHEPFDIAGREMHVTVSIGISDLARDGEDTDFLLRAAAAALRRAKELGGNQ